MTQYQSFPDATGSSKSLEKLQALRLPPLAGKSFLDVGCNEGFFCGFARYQGAAHVVGLDRNKNSIERAQSRFPDIDFFCQSWDEPVEGSFDVILLASALHYAKDQEALIHRLVGLLSPTGTLVLEIGLSKEGGNHWVAVKRSIDERQFPTRGKLAAILDQHAWKIIGKSVDQAGDPLARVVVHIQKKRPYAFLLMSPSGFGKTTITRLLRTAKKLVHVSGDSLMRAVSEKTVDCDPHLSELVQQDYASTNIAQLTQHIFKHNLGEQWVDTWLSKTDGKDVIIDSFVPQNYWDFVVATVKARGFVPIQLTWDLIGPKLEDRYSYNAMAFDYVSVLQKANTHDGNGESETSAARIRKLLTLKKRKVDTQSARDEMASLPDDFDGSRYLEIHPDVAKAGMNPALHYLRHGIREGRRYK